MSSPVNWGCIINLNKALVEAASSSHCLMPEWFLDIAGAMIACKLAAMVPERISSLALLNVTGGGYECIPKV